MIKTVNDLDVFRLSFEVAMEIFDLTKTFPKEEKYSLTDQIIRSARSVSANIAEGWGKRVYENEFKKHLVYAMGSLEETKVWMMFALESKYLSEVNFNEVAEKLNIVGAKIFKLYANWKTS